jgi:hypothetical protein
MFDTNLEFLDSRHEEMNLVQTLREYEILRKKTFNSDTTQS